MLIDKRTGCTVCNPDDPPKPKVVVCNTREQVEAKRAIEKEMARLDLKLERSEPEILWGDYDALRKAMTKASRAVVLSSDFCEFTKRHQHILNRLINEGAYNEPR